MLEKMRTHSRNWLIYVIFGAIILVFAINFGPGFDQMSQTGCSRGLVTAAEVNGESISRRLFLMQWRNYVQLRRLSPKLQNTFTKNRVLDELVQLYLLAQHAREYGVSVSDDEVEKTLIKDTSFHRDGIFDQNLYKNVTSFYRLTPKEYADFIRVTLQADKIRRLMNNSLSISDEEVKQAFMQKNDKVTVEYVLMDPNQLHYPATFSAAQADDFAKKHADRLKKYYDGNLDKFSQEKQIRASHLLLTVSKGTPAAKEADIRKKIDSLYEEAKKAPEKFADLAKKHSQGPSNKVGGDLGYFTFARMVKPFSEAAFALKKVGDISKPVKTDFGYHIIKLTGIKPEKRELLSDQDVKRRIARVLLEQDKTQAELKKVATQLLAYAKKGKSLKDALKQVRQEFAVSVTETVPASLISPSKQAPASRPTASQGGKQAAPTKTTSRPVVKGQQPPAVRVAAITKPASRPVVVTQPKVVKKDWLSSLRTKTTPPFPQDSDLIPGLKDRGALIHPVIRSAFALDKKNPLPSNPIASEDKIYVLRFVKRTSAKSLDQRFSKEKESYRERLLTSRQLEYVTSWLKYLEKKATIRKNQTVLQDNYQL